MRQRSDGVIPCSHTCMHICIWPESTDSLYVDVCKAQGSAACSVHGVPVKLATIHTVHGCVEKLQHACFPCMYVNAYNVVQSSIATDIPSHFLSILYYIYTCCLHVYIYIHTYTCTCTCTGGYK